MELGGLSFGKDKPNMPNRGGARHIQKPWVDAGLLHTCFSKHKGLVSNMHAYEHISSGNAPDPKALLSLQALWSGLVALEPSGLIHPQPLRQALLSLLGEFPELNTSKHTGEVWCNLKVERLNCMLAHVRKLGRPNADIGPVVGKLTSAEYVKLKAGLEQLQLEGLEKPIELPVEKAPAEALEKASSSSPQLGEKSGKAKRKLTTRSSDVTVDSDGLPHLFKSPDPKTMKRPASALEKAGPAEDLQLVSMQRPGSRLHEVMGYGLKRPKAKAKPGKAKAKANQKKPSAQSLGKGKAAATGLGKDKSGGRQQWVSINQTNAKMPERSYLQGKYSGGSKHLIVEVTAKQSPHYMAIIGKIRESLEKDWITKPEALEMKAQLLSKYGN